MLSIAGIYAGTRMVRASAASLEKHLASVMSGIAAPGSSTDPKRQGMLSMLAGGIHGSLAHIRIKLVAVKNIWRKNYELSQDIRSNSQAISEGIQVVSRSSDLLENSAAKLDGKISDSKKTIDAMQATLENANAVSESQAAAVEESSAAIEELISSIRSIAGISEEKRSALNRLAVTVERSRTEINNTIDAFASINESTRSILDLAVLIREIAEQTNLLSMNAAIEAAHAGEQGRGFAVVADEIKKLAESSRKNASSISGTLKGVRASIDHSLSTSGVLKASIDEVLGSVRETTSSMEEIISGMSEMSAGTAQISAALSTLVETSEESKKNTAEILGTSRLLQEHIGEIENNSESNVSEVKTITRSVHRISESLKLLSTISEDNARNLTLMRDKLETIPTRKRFVCDYLPPYQYIAEDKITGVFTEIVELLLADLHEEASIEFMPWAEAIAMAQDEPEIFLLTALRTAQREKQFRWIGPVVPDKHYLFRLSNRNDIKVRSAGDLKDYRLGSVANNYSYKYFIDNGVPEQNIHAVKVHSMNIQNLLLGEVDMIPMSTLQLTHQLQMMKRDMGDVTPAFLIDSFPTDAYLAVSVSTPDEVFSKYEEGFERIRKTREFKEILKKYGA
jgi:methyl-accepting chemotaxis protein